jgi:dTDP-4-dehydrorhamnose reductase/SAM-dependent methyltransferase
MDKILSNALILGGTGMIGSFFDFGIKPSSKELNIINLSSIESYINKLENNISCIINLVALNLRDSEKDIFKTIDININGTSNLLKIAKKLNIPFILLSSGAVFSSKNNISFFTENTETNPNCLYGYSKSAAEKIALLYEKSIVIRTGWVFGGSQKTHYKFVENFINNFLTNTKIYANNNFFGSPTYVMDLIEKIKYLISNNIYGVHHLVNSDVASGYDVAVEIARLMSKNVDLIESVSHNMIPNPGPERSMSEILQSNFEINKMRNWKDALKEYLFIYLNIKNNNNYVIKNEKIENSIWQNRERCRLCDSIEIDIFFKLNPTPQANHFVNKPVNQEKIPLDICICNKCKHIQLLQIVNPSFQYSNYLYVTSASKTMINHILNSIEIFLNKFNVKKTDNILEIGANDGTGIKYLIENGYNNSVGVDPAENINDNSLPIICDYFSSDILKYEKINKGSFKLIYGFHCCAHIENIQDVFSTVYNLLTDDGIFIMEVGYFYEVYKNHLFDTIYHEHIDYHTCKAMKHFCEKNNLTLFDVKTNKIQSGSIQFYISKDKNTIVDKNVDEFINQEENINLFDINNLYKWKNNILLNSRDLNYLLRSLINEGKTIFGYGASAKSTTFTHQFNLSNNIIKYIIDDSYLKQNLFTPGYNIPIVSIDILNTEKCDYLIILSWNFLDDILVKIDQYRKAGLRVIIAFPNICII